MTDTPPLTAPRQIKPRQVEPQQRDFAEAIHVAKDGHAAAKHRPLVIPGVWLTTTAPTRTNQLAAARTTGLTAARAYWTMLRAARIACWLQPTK